jgi:hypothetical protein
MKVKGFLPGRYVLMPRLDIPSPTKQPPHEKHTFSFVSHENLLEYQGYVPVFEYVPLDKSLTPEQFLDLWQSKRISVVEWSFTIEKTVNAYGPGRRTLWKQKEIPPPAPTGR